MISTRAMLKRDGGHMKSKLTVQESCSAVWGLIVIVSTRSNIAQFCGLALNRCCAVLLVVWLRISSVSYVCAMLVVMGVIL